jgi:hypothetical protein
MKLVSTLFGMKALKALAMVFFMLIAVNSYSRVFWNQLSSSVKNNQVTLNWEVTEYNNRSFHIQHSMDGVNWIDIDSVVSKHSSLSLENYTFSLTNKIGGKHFYRVRDEDVDYKLMGYSEIIVVTVKSQSEEVMIWPNPATTQIRIACVAARDNVYTVARIFDLSGKMVAEKKLQPNADIIMISDLTPGVYFLRAETSCGKVSTQKLVKQ